MERNRSGLEAAMNRHAPALTAAACLMAIVIAVASQTAAYTITVDPLPTLTFPGNGKQTDSAPPCTPKPCPPKPVAR